MSAIGFLTPENATVIVATEFWIKTPTTSVKDFGMGVAYREDEGGVPSEHGYGWCGEVTGASDRMLLTLQGRISVRPNTYYWLAVEGTAKDMQDSFQWLDGRDDAIATTAFRVRNSKGGEWEGWVVESDVKGPSSIRVWME
ncbi:hypothetical protein HK104_004490 [Borealophlyctis nickersoniae]|nr:hypothetical protein HK104_004490 [Borealophlyctis nickersoniae]